MAQYWWGCDNKKRLLFDGCFALKFGLNQSAVLDPLLPAMTGSLPVAQFVAVRSHSWRVSMCPKRTSNAVFIGMVDPDYDITLMPVESAFDADVIAHKNSSTEAVLVA